MAVIVGLVLGLGVLSLLWLRRTVLKERLFLSEIMADTVQASGKILNMHQQAMEGRAEVTFLLNQAEAE